MNAVNENNSSHSLNVALGFLIRTRRRELGLSQEQLARRAGITFQQVRRYEYGTNRVSFLRLVEIARGLRCSATDIVGDLYRSKSSPLFSSRVARLNEPNVVELLDAFTAIESPNQRRAILKLVKQLARG